MTTKDQQASELVATAVKTALEVTETAAGAAKEVVAAAASAAATARVESQDDDDRVTRALATALRRVFGENQEAQRFIDVSRIPLICQNIDGIHSSIKKIEDKLDTRYLTVEAFAPYKMALNAIAGLVLVAVVGGLLSLILIK